MSSTPRACARRNTASSASSCCTSTKSESRRSEMAAAVEQPELTDRFLHALELAVEAHRHQTDKAGEPYAWHVIRVGASLLPDEEAAVVGLLHDVLEDCGHYAHWAGRIRSTVSDRQ